ncbi:hypothetical protein K3727_23250 (plasmid) [Rhodobacteraceae bacterium M382]|nr:hypothetical protein K3727_23250 [Rhodobacteraceae bacterium M382]
MVFGLLIASILFALDVARFPFGKSLRALRDNNDSARARGIPERRRSTLPIRFCRLAVFDAWLAATRAARNSSIGISSKTGG